MDPTQRRVLEQEREGLVLEGGVVAGLIGGVLLALWIGVVRLASGLDLWPALKGPAYPFLGDRVLQAGFDPTAVTVGIVVHFAVAVVWGLLFAVAFKGLTRAATMAAGVFWGLVTWVVMFYVVLPLIGAGEIVATTPVWQALVGHLAFGVGCAIGFLPFQIPIVREPYDERKMRPL